MNDEQLKQRMLEVLKETVDYYSEDFDRRSVFNNGCFYFSEGRMCAVGRCLIDPEGFEENAKDISGDTTISHLKDKVDFNFKDEYKGLPINFWSSIQELHDKDKFWQEDHQPSKLERYRAVCLIENNIENGIYLNSEKI